MDRSRVNRIFNRLARAMEQQSRVMVQIVTQDDSIDAGNGLYWGMAQLREGQTLTRVRAPRTKPFPGAFYKAKASPDDGVLELLDPDPVTVNGFFAGLPDPMAALNTPNHGWTHRGPIGLDPLWVNPQQLLGLQTRPATPNSLSVVVSDYPPLAFAPATLDLISYVPGPGYQRFVIVALDVKTGALAVTESTPVSGGPGFAGIGPGAVSFTAADVAALAVDHNYLASAAVRLYFSQTAIQWRDIFIDLRALAGQRDGYLRLDDADPTLDGLVAKLVSGPGVSISRQAGDALVLSATGLSGADWGVDAPPDTASALDDEFDDASFDTGLWTEYDSGSLETVAETGGLLSLSQASQAFAILTGVYQAVPAGDFTIACKLRIDHDSLSAAGSIQAGIVLWNNAGSDAAEAVVLGPGVWHDTSDHDGFGYGYFTSRVSLNLVNFGGDMTASTWYYLRVRRSGTSYYFDWSTDGVTWTEQNFTSNMPFVPDHFGLGLYNGASGFTLQADAEFFRYRGVFDSVGEPVYGRSGILLTHADLAGLNADDHTQYHTDARGDARYSQLDHTHVEADITDLSHDAVAIQGRDVASTAPGDGDALVWSAATSQWQPGAVATESAEGDFTKFLPFTEASLSPSPIFTPDASALLREIAVQVYLAGSAGAPTVSVGTASDPDAYMDELAIDLRETGLYVVQPMILLEESPGEILLTITPDSQSFIGNVYVMASKVLPAVYAYWQRLRTVMPTNLLAYWRLNESSGVPAADSSGRGFAGAVSGVTWGATGIGDDSTAAALDGVNDYINVYSTGLRDAFNGAAGTIVLWFRVGSAGVWTDGGYRYMVNLAVDSSNYIRLRKDVTNNRLSWNYAAGGTVDSVVDTSLAGNTAWHHTAMTWDKAAEQLKVYLDGVQIGGTQINLGTWAGSLSSTAALLGAYSAGAYFWSGDLAHAALWNVALSAAEIAELAAV